jgi:hypothetical protein
MDPGNFGRYWDQNKAIVGIFNGSVVYYNVVNVLVFLARVIVVVKKLTSNYFEKKFGR